MDVVRDRDGHHYLVGPRNRPDGLVVLAAATQDRTGHWRTDVDADLITITRDALDQYTQVPPARREDQRITRLAALVEQLLAEHEQATGRPAAGAAEIRAALEEVQGIPEEWSRKRLAAVQQARRR